MIIILFVLFLTNYSLCFPYLNEIGDNWYHFKYSTLDSEREETGQFLQKDNNDLVWVVTGYYYYKIDNTGYNISYISDDNGYRATQTRTPLATNVLVPPQLDDVLSSDISMRVDSTVLTSLAGGGIG